MKHIAINAVKKAPFLFSAIGFSIIIIVVLSRNESFYEFKVYNIHGVALFGYQFADLFFVIIRRSYY